MMKKSSCFSIAFCILPFFSCADPAVGAEGDVKDLTALLNPARADIDGDGVASAGETMTFGQLLALEPEATLIANLILAYSAGSGDSSVNLQTVLAASVDSSPEAATLGTAGEEVLLASTCTRFIRGDANGDGLVNGSDPIFILNYLFMGGPAPPRLDAADANDSGSIDMTDAVYLNNYLFLGGPRPLLPYSYPGLDPTPDGLETTCDLRPENFAEFHTFFPEMDVTGDSVVDPIYIVPNNVIEIDPLNSTLERITFATLSSSVTITKIAVAANRVVYALTSGTTVYGMLDTDGNGIRNTTKTFTLPSPPVDAVLIDTPDGQGLVTLHNAGSRFGTSPVASRSRA